MPHQRRPPLLREFIEIPEASAISDSDFVFRLTDGVSDAEATLRDYIIPPGLIGNFDQALGLIFTALASGVSKAAYLHGSFGSGKSHFMAVLYALLRGDRVARTRAEFAPLLARHDSWLAGRRFMLVPYHMPGARSLEQRVLGGYVKHVRRVEPNATMPQVHRVHVPLDDAQRFISLDRGLTEIAGHAESLGYDAVVLFLDELILWLASASDDRQFLASEILKITDFVEGGDAHRPIPVITFVARQRDLRELLGKEFTGASELGFQDTLSLISGRFDVITLADRDLAEIVRGRLLRRVGDDEGPADSAIARAFDGITRVRPEIWNTLLGSDAGQSRQEAADTSADIGADLESFRKTYPFSPAFLATLVRVSSALQRTRTALKLMRQLLVDRRDEIRLGQLVPLGDLYDVISRSGDQPLTRTMKAEFEAAQRFYQHQFGPYLLDRYGLTDDDLDLARRGIDLDSAHTARVRSFTGDDRLIKTLLLAALVPTVPALRNLTARKLAALNHGSISSPIPGGEVGQIGRKLAEWAGHFGEIKVSTGESATAGLELVGFDVDGILKAARHFDTAGDRRALVQRLLWEELRITSSVQDRGWLRLAWRGSPRVIEVLFESIWDEEKLRDEAVHPTNPSLWRLIIDYPWDDETHALFDDRAMERLRDRSHAQTICWIPVGLTAHRRGDLGRLVVLDTVLDGQRFGVYTRHLGENDRRRAHSALTLQRDSLMARMRDVLRQAYGVAAKQPGDVLTTYDSRLLSLGPGPPLTVPTGARFADAALGIADQLLRRQYPAHPDFDPGRRGEVLHTSELRTVLEYVRRAVETPTGRIEVDRKDRPVMRRVAGPLRLGEMHEVAFILGRYWADHFERLAAKEGIDGDVRVTDLRRWLDQPEPRGLDPLVAQLVFACFAEQTDRTWIRYGGVVTPQPELTAIGSDLALRMPERLCERDWVEARKRSVELFGFLPPALRRGRLVALFVQDLSRQAQRYGKDAHRLRDELGRRFEQLGLDPDRTTGRLHTARMAADLLDGLTFRRDNVEIVRHLARADLGGPADRAGRSIRSAADVVQALRGAPWDTFGIVEELGDQWSGEATAILATLRQAAADDELATPLAPALNRARIMASDLVRRATRLAGQIGPDPTEESGGTITTCEEVESALAQVREAARRRPGRQIQIRWRVL